MMRPKGTGYQLRVESDNMPLLFEGIPRQRRDWLGLRLDSCDTY